MGLTGFNRARRAAAEVSGRSPEGLSYDEAIAILRSANSGEESKPSTESNSEGSVETEQVLILINAAESANDLVQLPTIGKAIASKILKNRPEAGYESFDQVKALNADLTTVDWKRVQESA